MSSSKKNQHKSAKSPTPAAKVAAAKGGKKVAPAVTPPAAEPIASPVAATPTPPPQPAPAPVFAAAAANGTTSAPVSASVSAPVAPPAAAPAPAPVRVVATKPMVTTITARIDVGYGNTLYLRGEGAGINWERGVAMNCVASDQWTITLPESARAFTFKFLINDVAWSTGPDFTAGCGTSVKLSPTF
jgi:hypothetical protein